MLKDFSQPFIRKPTHVYLLVQDEKTGKFLTQESSKKEDYYDDGVPEMFYLSLEADDDLALRLAGYLYSLGISLNSFRELARTSAVSFSLADATPGNITDTICLHAKVDITTHVKQSDSGIALQTLEKVAEQLWDYKDHTLGTGISRLLSEHG